MFNQKANSGHNSSALNFEALRQTLWQPIRRAPRVEDNLMMADTARWLNNLPPGLRPCLLQQRYPRIVNQLFLLWPSHDKTLAYFDSLLADKRGDREGFHPLIEEELTALFRHAVKRKAALASVPVLNDIVHLERV